MRRSLLEQISLQALYVGKSMGVVTKSFGRKLGILTNHTKLVNTTLAGITPDLGMYRLTMDAHLGHIAERQYFFTFLLRQHLDSRPYRIGVGIITIVNKLKALGQIFGLHTPLHWPKGLETFGNGRQGNAQSTRARTGCQSVV